MKRGLTITAALMVLTAQLLSQTGLAEELQGALQGLLEDGSLLRASVCLELGVPPAQSEAASGAENNAAAEMASRLPEAVRSRRTEESLYAAGRAEASPSPRPESSPAPRETGDPAESTPSPAAPSPELPAVLPTTIEGGLCVTNDTSFAVDIPALLAEGPSLRLPEEGPQVLIIHTHGTEAYTPEGEDLYISTDPFRTTDENYNVIRVGDELAAVLEAQGLRVIHDRGLYDYPSYTGSYGRSGAAVESWLAQYPELTLVIDLHRDALGTGDVVYKTMADLDGGTSSQLMLLVGTGENGLPHPHWRENLKLALFLQDALTELNPTLMRPVAIKPERYNQHLTTASLILEVGSSGNTLQEALCAIRLFGETLAESLRP